MKTDDSGTTTRPNHTPPAKILKYERLPDLVYAIGDVHGCLEKLLELERLVAEDRAKMGTDALIIMLGDYIDRGPQSAQTLEHLIAPPPEHFSRVCTMGNHEAAMLRFLENKGIDRGGWLGFGGYETLMSYGLTHEHIYALGRDETQPQELTLQIPTSHFRFLRDLPHALGFPDHIFVHAGIDPNRALEQQSMRDLLWIRERFLSFDGPLNRCVVHGHTPVADVEVSKWRLNVDTGAYATGKLSAAKLVRGVFERALST